MSCDDRYREEREGRDAARFGERYDYDHLERMSNARWDSDSCDAYYARGYEREIERRNEQRAEEEREEQRSAMAYNGGQEEDHFDDYGYPQPPASHSEEPEF